jgi:transcriptional regulator with XRE-family HTH domain
VLVSPSSTRHFAAERLKEIQAAGGLTNEALALQVGCSPRLLQKWRAGTVTPSAHYQFALARVLDVSAEDFYTDHDSTKAAA